MINNNELVSIILPAYNAEQYIGRAIDSLLCQSYSNIEIIIVDDGSTDNTASICKKKKETDDRITLVSQKNKGGAAARNTGIRCSRGKFLCFLDADDHYDEHYVELMHRTMVDDRTELVVCGYWQESEIERLEKKPRNMPDGIEQKCNELIDCCCMNSVWNKLFIKSKIRSMFDESLTIAEDLKFICAYISRISSISLLPLCLYYYNTNNPMSIMHNKNAERSTIRVEYKCLGSLYKIKGFSIDKVYRWLINRINDCITKSSYPDYKHDWISLNELVDFSDMLNKCRPQNRVVLLLIKCIRKKPNMFSYMVLKLLSYYITHR